MARNDLRLVWDGCPPAALKIAIGHDVGFFTGPEGTCIDAETPEQMRDILNDYCRAKFDSVGLIQ